MGEGGRTEAIKVIPGSESSMSKWVDVPSSIKVKKKGVAIDDYESGSNVYPEEERIFDEGFTWVEVRVGESSYFIVIPLDCDLLTNTKSMVPSLVPLCYGAENMTLRSFKDVNMSLGISGMALRVSLCFPFCHFCILRPSPFLSLLALFSSSFLFLRPLFWRSRASAKRRSMRLFSRRWF